MIRVRITRNTVAAKRPVMVGEVLDLPDAEAHTLTAMRKAEVVIVQKTENPVEHDEELYNAHPLVEQNRMIKKYKRR